MEQLAQMEEKVDMEYTPVEEEMDVETAVVEVEVEVVDDTVI